MTVTIGGAHQRIDPADVDSFVRAALDGLDLDGRTLTLVIPDGTRNCPVAQLVGAVVRAVARRVSSCVAVVALGTHAPMGERALRDLVGTDEILVRNHEWWDDSMFVQVGTLDRHLVSRLSGEKLDEPVAVRINRLVVDSDVTLIVGPVMPHEVVGFSGGNKYLFPGLSGQELIDVTHWLGALITSNALIGVKGSTPVRALIDAAAELVPGERHALCVVVDRDSGELESMAFGSALSAWAEAVEVAAESHVELLAEPVERVLSLVPVRYHDLWTGAKGFYKVEPAVADGGEVVIFAPHITEIAAMHPGIGDLGYHCRDYFLADWDRYRHLPRGDLAHSTHLFGQGTFDPAHGEHQRVQVTLATGIPRDVVQRANLGWLDPATVDVAAWTADPRALVVPDAGEVLYRVRR